MNKKPATNGARALRSKLQALAARGVNGERDAAELKLRRLLSRYDFDASAEGPDLFAGAFQRASDAVPLAPAPDMELASFAKWAIENGCKIPCVFRAGQLCAEATPKTAKHLQGIVSSITEGFTRLWATYQQTPGTHSADRGVFMMGLYEGMLGEQRANTALPRRAVAWKPAKAKRKALAAPAGVSLHPYSVAYPLGKQVRFCVPLDAITEELNHTLKGELTQ